jgi:hypothetical protein
MGSAAARRTEALFPHYNLPRKGGADRMKKLPRIAHAEPVMHGVLKLVFVDGYEGMVDLRPLISKGNVFTWLQNPDHFAAVRIDEHGHAISWCDDTGYEIDISADSLRRDSVLQAEIHRLMVG